MKEIIECLATFKDNSDREVTVYIMKAAKL